MFGDRRGLRSRRHRRQIAQPRETVDIIEEIGRYVGPGEMERIVRAFLAAKAQFALEQRIAARDIAEKGILGHRDQLEWVASAQAQRVDRGAPGEAMEAILQPLGERESLLAPQPDQPLAFLDTVGGGIVLVSAHPPLSARITAKERKSTRLNYSH